jgi:D-arabinose 1-dehydrogenase-like Zn-dependent alcohol dehydrogenase
MNIGVIGIGGLGHMAIQLLRQKDVGATAFTSKSNESNAIKELGANQVVAYESNSLEIASYDRLFITTPAQINYDYYLRLLKPDGELWVIGSATKKTQFSSGLLNDFASRSIHGSYIGSPAK